MNLHMFIGPDATPPYPVVHRVRPADLNEALAKGVNDFLPILDFLAGALFLVSHSIIFAIISTCLIGGGLPLHFPLMSGFALTTFSDETLSLKR